jgi:hypothetical protein
MSCAGVADWEFAFWGWATQMKNRQKDLERSGQPTARVAEALARANGILAMLSQCYDVNRGAFAVTDGFVIQSVAAIETFVGEAQIAFSELHLKADDATPGETATVPKTFAIETGGAARFSMSDPEQVDDANLFEPSAEGAPGTADASELRAQSYEELLRKLTAAEVFAQEQQALSDGSTTSPLLPLLRSLKEDLKKVRAA